MSNVQPLDRAIAAAGGEDAFMCRVGIKRRALFYWKAEGIPLVRLQRVVEVTGIPAHELRPDLFAAPSTPASEVAA
jgi:hypothetical protein